LREAMKLIDVVVFFFGSRLAGFDEIAG